MSDPVRIVGFVAGVWIVVVTATSVFTTLVIPRATSSRLLRSVSRFMAKTIKPFLRRLDTYEAKDRVDGTRRPARDAHPVRQRGSRSWCSASVS